MDEKLVRGISLGIQLQHAIRFAAESHQGQSYGSDGLPYLLHLSQVLGELSVAEREAPSVHPALTLLCGVLHDTVEDTEVTCEELAERFGPSVAAGVAALSKSPSLRGRAALLDSLERIEKQPREIWRVKLADRISNLQPPPAHWSHEKQRAYCDEAELILSRLGVASRPLAERLRSAIERYRQAIASPKDTS